MSDLPLFEDLAPVYDAWTVARRLAHLPHLLFLDSARTGPPLGRYSFICADPFGWLESRGGRIKWILEGVETSKYGDPFDVVRQLLGEYQSSPLPNLPPFQGGAAGLFGYELNKHIERLPKPRFDDFEVPDLALGFYDWVIAFDHVEKSSWIISTGLPKLANPDRQRRAQERLKNIKRLITQDSNVLLEAAAAPPNLMAPKYPVEGFANVSSNFSRSGYLKVVRRAIDYINAGDCFQVNISQRLLYPATLPTLEQYDRLRQRNPAPFAGYFDVGAFTVLSASPERFLQVQADQVFTRPIKGTRPRGQTPAEDQRLREGLLRSAKDRAENVMIIDLLRNDLGRVCSYGSIEVTAVCQLETYQTVHHLVSEVRGRLRAGSGPVDVLRAAFPGGSVTGAPKVRAMEIINELEPTARGPYCGSLGYIGFDGTMDTNILIRTLTAGRGWLQFPVGGGIVADSTPENEYAETLHKAEGLLRALR